ncbi:hypothetical protein V5O48_005369 [Marasmius crinis-equi]|uniref:Uncharacterized protein n=1 Tax=Marasmius crinis-equi TaxID=585013 RepID=A0ABR3FMF4_9AGAR
MSNPLANITSVPSRAAHPPVPRPQVHFLAETDFSIDINPHQLLAIEEASATVPSRPRRFHPYPRPRTVGVQRLATSSSMPMNTTVPLVPSAIGQGSAQASFNDPAKVPSNPPTIGNTSLNAADPAEAIPTPTPSEATPRTTALINQSSTLPVHLSHPSDPEQSAATSSDDTLPAVPGAFSESESDLSELEEDQLAPVPFPSAVVPPTLGSVRQVFKAKPANLPKGVFQLIRAIGLGAEGNAINQKVKELAKQYLDTSRSYTAQKASDISRVKEEAAKVYSSLNTYEERWPVDELLKFALKNTKSRRSR